MSSCSARETEHAGSAILQAVEPVPQLQSRSELIQVKAGSGERGRHQLSNGNCWGDVDQLPTCIGNLGDQPSDFCPRAELREHGKFADLCGACYPRRLVAGQHLFMEGDRSSHLHWIKSGAVRLYKLRQSGQRQIIGFKFSGDFAELGHSPTHRYSAQAMTKTELRVLPSAKFNAVAADDARFMSKLYDAVDVDLSSAHELIMTMGQRSATESIAAFLLELELRMYRQGGRSELMLLPMTRSDIADYLGLTIETVSRVFTALRKRGVIEVCGHRRIRMKDGVTLRRISNGYPHHSAALS